MRTWLFLSLYLLLLSNSLGIRCFPFNKKNNLWDVISKKALYWWHYLLTVAPVYTVVSLASGHVLRVAMQQLVVTERRAGTEARWGRVMRRDGDKTGGEREGERENISTQYLMATHQEERERNIIYVFYILFYNIIVRCSIWIQMWTKILWCLVAKELSVIYLIWNIWSNLGSWISFYKVDYVKLVKILQKSDSTG